MITKYYIRLYSLTRKKLLSEKSHINELCCCECEAEATHCSVRPTLSLTQPLVATLEQHNLLNWYPCCVV